MPKCYVTACVAATLSVAAIAIASSLVVAGPIIAYDEYGYLSNARALAGRGRPLDMPGFGSYPWGYSLILSPLAAVLDSSRSFHRGALILNGLLLASLVPLGVATLTRLKFAPWPALGGALLVATHPSLFTYAHLAFSENLFVPLHALAILTLLILCEDRSSRAATVLGVALAASPFVRYNGIATAMAGTAILVLLAARRETRRPALCGLASLAATAGALAALEQLLLPGFRAYGGTSGTSFLVSAMAHPALFLQTLAGQFVSISLASWLLFPILLAVAVHYLLGLAKPPRESFDGLQAGILFAAAASFGTLLVSALLMHSQTHPECVIYARYGEGLLPLLVWGGLAGMRKRSGATLVLGSATVLVLLSLVVPPLGDRPPIQVVAAPSLFHPVHAWGLRSLPSITVLLAAPMVAGWWMLGRRSRVVAAAAIALQLAVGADIVRSYVVPGSRFRRAQSAYVTDLERLGTQVERVAFLKVEPVGRTEGALSYALPSAEMLRLTTAEEALSRRAQVLIAGKDQAEMVPSDYRLVALQWRGPLATWVRRGIDVPDEKEMPLHEIVLPPDEVTDRRVLLTLSDTVRLRGGRVRLRLRVANTSGDYFPDRGVLIGSPWPMVPVRVGLWFADAAGRAVGEDRLELPHPLYPGQHVDLDGDVPVPEGAASLAVRLLQEGRGAIGPEQRYPLDVVSP